VLILILLSRVFVSSQGAEELPSGFAVTFLSDSETNSDLAVLRNFQLFVPNGESPRHLSPRKVHCHLERPPETDLRGEYAFRAALNGEAKLTVNNKVIIETKSPAPIPFRGSHSP
jgi:hypothetical protein